MSVRLLTGDCVEHMRAMPECSVDAIVTDPPYGLGFMGKAWDAAENVAFRADTWAEALRVLKPGGYLLAFGGTRTYHRLACAIEDAGFEVRDMMAWLYGSGFPKGTDKAKIPEAWRGWNTALKPAQEPICLARKALQGTLAENLTRWGTGALNIDGCRVGTESTVRPINDIRVHGGADGAYVGLVGQRPTDGRLGGSDCGRWPANLIHDGSEEVLAAFPADRPGFSGGGTKGAGFRGAYVGGDKHGKNLPAQTFNDTGSAARFFWSPKASRADRNDGLHGMPEQVVSVWGGDEDDLTAGKKSTRPRANSHPTVKPTDLMRYLCRLVTPPGGLVLDPFMGSGSTCKAAELEGFRAIGIELDPAYVEIARRRIGSDAPLFAEVDA